MKFRSYPVRYLIKLIKIRMILTNSLSYRWADRGMTDSADEIKGTIKEYLSRMKLFS